MSSLRGAAAAVGVAERDPVRYSGDESLLDMLSDVAAEALADAGIGATDVDGLLVHSISGIPSFVPAAVGEYVGVTPRFAEFVDLGGATGAGMVWRAAAAINAGMCTTCLCLTGSTRRRRPLPTAPRPKPSGEARRKRDRSVGAQFEAPYGLIGANVGYALIASQYEHRYGDTTAARAKIAVEQRRNANVNPAAIFHDQPLTIDDVLSSEMVAEPLRKLEIVMPAEGAAAVVVTSAERATDRPHPAAWILGAGESVTHMSLANMPDLSRTGIAVAAERAFAQAGVRPGDVGLASLYDCYTIMVLLTLEQAGFCGPGEGAAFVDEHSLTYDGAFPLNPHGGQLSFGQPGMAGGMSHVTEAIRQIQAARRTAPD